MNRFANAQKFGVSILSALLIAGCSGSGGDTKPKKLNLQEVQNGFGLVLPYQVKDSTAPVATAPILKLQTMADLKKHVSSTNPILPVSTWPTTATLPNGASGNHFIAIEFTQPIDMHSILDGTSGSPTYGLKGTITVTQRDMTVPSSPVTTAVKGRAFVNGYTATAPGVLTKVISLNSGGQPTSSLAAYNGFPGVISNFSGASKLVSPNVFVFVADTSSDGLNNYDTFPANVEILVSASEGVLSEKGKPLLDPFVCASTVGSDTIPPEILIDASQNPNVVSVDPVDGSSNVSPQTDIELTFTEPVQPAFVGDILNTLNPTAVGTVKLTSGSQTAPTSINFPFYVSPKSVYDLTTYILQPTVSFPAASPVNLANAPVLNFVQIEIFNNKLGDMIVQTGTGVPGVGAQPQNRNTISKKTSFQTGDGPGIVNAPVSPESIYVGRVGPSGGISVIDLNGFGQSTGDPTNNGDNVLDSTDVSKFPFNPNIAQSGTSGQIVPALVPGNTTLDGGSAGVFTLTKDTALSDRLYIPGTISDIHIGRPLDAVFSNAPSPLGSCATGGSNCNAGGFHTLGATLNWFEGNPISGAPVPNPPKLEINPVTNCLSPQILGQEPTSVNSGAQTNLLVPAGNAFGTIGGSPPNGLVYTVGGGTFQNAFVGPSPNGPTTGCQGYRVRQQLGHFLYVVDTSAKELLVLNSNRMTKIDAIKLPDPRKLAMSPDLKLIAVTNFSTNNVSFIGIDPFGTNFHKIVATVPVGKGPMGVSWQPGNEDIFVCNNLDSSITVIKALDLSVRKTIKSGINHPIDVYLSERQNGLGFSDGVYFGFILNQDGKMAVFESGPSTTAGAIGFDDVVGQITATFPNPVGIVPAYNNGVPSAYVMHQSPGGGAQISLVAETASPGQQPLDPQTSNGGNFTPPSFRNREFTVAATISSLQLSGSTPTDLALDDCMNNGGMAANIDNFSGIPAAQQNGKGLVRGTNSVSYPTFLFVACGDVGVVDVIQLTTLTKFKPGGSTPVGQQQFTGTIAAPGCAVLAHYWRQ